MLSPELLDLPTLDLDLIRRLLGLEADSEGMEIQAIELVHRWPDSAVALDEGSGWVQAEGRLLVLAEDELSAAQALVRLARMSGGGGVPIVVPAGLRPTELRARGRTIAETWLAEDERPIHLVFAARPVSFALLSPYPDDLGATLFALARQSPSFRPHEGWSEVLAGPPSRDEAALLAEQLQHHRAELLEERRAAERSIGLALTDEVVVTHGVFAAAPSARVDPALGALTASGTRLHLAASRSPILLAEILRTVLEARRASSVTAVFESPRAPSSVFSADVFACDGDGLEHPAREALRAASALIDQVVDWSDTWIGEAPEWGVPIRLLRLTRRASLLSGARSEIPVCLVGHRAWDLSRDDPREASAPLRACRVALCTQKEGFAGATPVSTRPAYRAGTRRT